MLNYKFLDRTQVAALVRSSLQDVLVQIGKPYPEQAGEDIYLIGRQSVVDSLGLVTLIIDLEQRFEDEFGIALTIADERAVSQKNSPFLTSRSLTDYIWALIEQKC
jgi:hypothetical protein